MEGIRSTGLALGGPLLVLVMACAALVACGPAREPTAEELLGAAADKVGKLSSVRFTLTRVGEPAMLDPATSSRFTEATGEFQAPNRARATTKVISLLGALSVEVLWLPEGTFARNPFTGQFDKMPTRATFDPAAMLSPEGLPGILRASAKNAKIVGKEQLAGVDAHHIRADADGAQLSALTGGVVVAGTHSVDVWIAAATSHVLRITASEPGGSGSWRLELSDHDKPVEIKAP